MVTLDESIIAVSGLPSHHFGWRQFRAMGASALDICAVARGAFDGFVDLSPDAHGVWDYAGALLIVQEAGGVIVDALGRDLIVLDHDARRTPVAASSQALLDSLVAAATRRINRHVPPRRVCRKPQQPAAVRRSVRRHRPSPDRLEAANARKAPGRIDPRSGA